MNLLNTLLQPRALVLAAGTAAAMVCGAASAQTTFTGFTNGCFDACTPESDQSAAARTDLLGGLTYNNSNFSVISAGGIAGLGTAGEIAPARNVNNLGSWFLTGAPAFTYTGHTFTLRVNFTAPPGTSPNTALFTSTFLGDVSTTNNGGLFINFDNTAQNFTFNGGSFTLSVNDLTLAPPGTSPGSLGMQSGTILVQAVPEPETYALFLAGLGALGFAARRRKS